MARQRRTIRQKTPCVALPGNVQPLVLTKSSNGGLCHTAWAGEFEIDFLAGLQVCVCCAIAICLGTALTCTLHI
eukprot:CAMPEP_0119334084 /NCGR_PEP_ID=MMETSP1333-20130426/86622_1 /TAXON_ID=418940 /ORGANISM="Scyphosphaera apsteinii, Strain RCC1455" /LENGTH=73 /DNA_ID=CAMNT_0007344309 /DNA_START=270 /DNA_END=491 /DNA_ORIENTATION=+